MFEVEVFWHLTVCKQRIILNWIVWNRTVHRYKNGFGNNNQQWLMRHETKPNQNSLRQYWVPDLQPVNDLRILLWSLPYGL